VKIERIEEMTEERTEEERKGDDFFDILPSISVPIWSAFSK